MLCDNLEGWDGVGDRRKDQEGGAYIYPWLSHVDVWQKPRRYCKAIILQNVCVCVCVCVVCAYNIHKCLHISPGEGKNYPLQDSGLENSRDCVEHGITKSRTRLRDFDSLTHTQHTSSIGITNLTLQWYRYMSFHDSSWVNYAIKHWPTATSMATSFLIGPKLVQLCFCFSVYQCHKIGIL